ncbi:MAG: dTDP-4-amino-4,6-dideoxygalactose transaminase [Lachnospiraceae bacterium]|jgi:TDP-4-keto-6-deoxy-D-glucose transaminase
MEYAIPFNVPPFVGTEMENLKTACEVNHKISGDGPFTKYCKKWVEEKTGTSCCLFTTSGTDALEMASHLTGVEPGDEVIMPSYTFCSTADAFVLRRAVPVFVDIRPDTMNIDENKIEDAITDRTKVIVAMHYAGVGCEMDAIMDIAKRHHLMVVEDAAQAVHASYKGKALGTFGDFGCYSFHETKNYSMGEGGAVLIRDPEKVEEAEILREKGTNRSQFFRGQIDKYTWVNFGSSYLPSELNCAYLAAQLDNADLINNTRLARWEQYREELSELAGDGTIELPYIPSYCEHNAHMFYIKTKDLEERTALISFLKERKIYAAFHYVPLHTSPAGRKFGRFHGKDEYTTKESDRLVRLPMYYSLTPDQVHTVTQAVKAFYETRK